MERAELALETLGMSVAEGKAILHGIQEFVVAQHGIGNLKRKRVCPNCGRRYQIKRRTSIGSDSTSCKSPRAPEPLPFVRKPPRSEMTGVPPGLAAGGVVH
jgi:hypothetical protein